MFKLRRFCFGHKEHTFLARLMTILFVAVCLSGCSDKDSQGSLGIDVMAWTEKADKLIAKIKNAAADKDPIADRNNQEQAKRLEVELKKLEERSRVLEAEREGKL
jgi:hypothetical protein